MLRIMCGSTLVERRLPRRYDIGSGGWLVFALDKILDDFRDLLVILVVALLRRSGWSRLKNGEYTTATKRVRGLTDCL